MSKRKIEFGSLLDLGERMDSKDGETIRLAAALLRIRGKDGRIQPLRANAAQSMFEQKRGRQNIVLKARQMGITTWVAGRFFLRTALRPGATTLLVAHTREAAENIFGTVRRMWESLPENLREDTLRLRRSNVGELVFAKTGSEFRVASAADANAGRGLSVQHLHCSEVSRWPGDAKATLAGLRAALTPDGELVLESTPMGAYGAFYEAWCEAVEQGSGEARGGIRRAVGCGSGLEGGDVLVRHFFPWWLEPAYTGPHVAAEEMNEEEQNLAGRNGLSASQIGFRRGLERTYGVLRSQEFAEDPETCFRATGSCCFELEAVEKRLSEVPEPLKRMRNGALLEWLPPVAGRSYVIAVDTAGGGERGDFAAVQVLDLATGMQCAELQERLRPAELAEICVEMARRYGNALIAVERNNHGAAVLALLETRPGVGLYRQAGQSGWLTSAASKPEVIARLGTLLQESPERFFSRRFLGECRTFVSDERGRAGAASGAHDDLVMSMGIAHAVRAEVMEGSALRAA